MSVRSKQVDQANVTHHPNQSPPDSCFKVVGDDRPLQTITQSIEINAAPAQVWLALTEPGAGGKWRDAEFHTDWTPGVPFEITARVGEKKYRDKGLVVRFQPPTLLEYTYWSRVSGLPDTPECRSTIRMSLHPHNSATLLTVEHQVPPSPVKRGQGWEIGPESGWKHVQFYWRMTLPILKEVIERGTTASEPGIGS